jgi:hypothetical protein
LQGEKRGEKRRGRREERREEESKGCLEGMRGDASNADE